MRRHFVIPIILALFALSTSDALAQTVTIVTRSGDQLRAQMVDTEDGAGFAVRMNGRARDIPMSDVAIIDFAGDGRDVDRNDFARAGREGSVVLRNGRAVSGTLVDLQPSSRTAIVSDDGGQRNLPFSQIARIYLGTNGYGSRRSGNYGRDGRTGGQHDANYDRNGNSGSRNDGRPGQQSNNGRQGNSVDNRAPGGFGNGVRTLTIPSNQQWTDTGIDISRGQALHFSASGNIQLSENKGDFGTADGATSGRKAGNSPLPNAAGGLLIGRLNNGQPFAVGANADVTMPSAGRLYLGINDDYVPDNRGDFNVQVSQR